MITVSYLKDQNLVLMKLRGDTDIFKKVNDFFKRANIEYSPELKGRVISPYYFIEYDLLDNLKEVDSAVVISPFVYQQIKDSFYTISNSTEVVKKRLKYVPSIVNFTPVKGKHPYENYQLDDIKRFISTNRGGIYWSPGLGKAVFIAVHMSHLFHYGICDRALIISPSSGLYNLKKEILKFSKLFKDEDIEVISSKNKTFLNTDKKIYITTYRHFLSVSDYYYKKAMGKTSKNYRKACIPFDSWGKSRALYCDESHYISNPKARQTKVIHLHKDYFYSIYNLSGTPADKFWKYYSQIKLLDDKAIPYSYQEWVSFYYHMGNRFSRFAIGKPKPNKQLLFIEKVVGNLCIRRESETHLDLPDNLIKPVYIPLTEDHSYIYKHMFSYSLEKAKKKQSEKLREKGFFFNEIDNSVVKNSIILPMMALDNPKLIEKHVANNEDDQYTLLAKKVLSWKEEKHSKIPFLDDLVKDVVEEQGKKLIVWDSHPISLDYYKERYKKHNPLIVHGNMNIKDMPKYLSDIQVEFNNGSKHNLLLASQLVMKEAVTMVNCFNQVYVQRGYDLIPWLQSQKRIHRYGQKKTVNTYVFILMDTIEEKIHECLENKKDFNDILATYKKIDKESLLNIIQGK